MDIKYYIIQNNHWFYTFKLTKYYLFTWLQNVAYSLCSSMTLINFLKKQEAVHLFNLLQDVDSFPPPRRPAEGLDKEGGGSCV